jgi:hypothetical protein
MRQKQEDPGQARSMQEMSTMQAGEASGSSY